MRAFQEPWALQRPSCHTVITYTAALIYIVKLLCNICKATCGLIGIMENCQAWTRGRTSDWWSTEKRESKWNKISVWEAFHANISYKLYPQKSCSLCIAWYLQHALIASFVGHDKWAGQVCLPDQIRWKRAQLFALCQQWLCSRISQYWHVSYKW